jgi:hypothetical protein
MPVRNWRTASFGVTLKVLVRSESIRTTNSPISSCTEMSSL